MTIPALEAIRAAQQRLEGRIHRTPILGTHLLADQAGLSGLGLKCESLQKTGSFKVRGAFNAISQLDEATRKRGVITVSAGNHAQGVAWAASALGVRSTVVMATTASESKARASAGYGAEVVRYGKGAESFRKAEELAAEHGYHMVHPFDDADVITGTATVGVEILDDAPDVEAIVVPIGGGGLISGIASAVRALRPSVRVFGVEPRGASAMRRSLDDGRAEDAEVLDTIADGLASPYAGKLTYPIVRDLVDDVVLVDDAEIIDAIKMILSRTKLLAEPAGAAAIAALLVRRIPALSGKRVVAVLSGGNIDLDRLKTML